MPRGLSERSLDPVSAGRRGASLPQRSLPESLFHEGSTWRKKVGGKFHKNFIFYKMFVDILNGFDMGSAGCAETDFTIRNGA
jgi:hypothetical protein